MGKTLKTYVLGFFLKLPNPSNINITELIMKY